MNALSRLVETVSKHSRHMAVSLFIFSYGCGASLTQSKPKQEPLSIEAIAIPPIEWRLRDGAVWQRYEKNRDLVISVAEFNNVDVIGPWEFDRIKNKLKPHEYQTQTNLFPRARTMRINPKRVLVLETTIEEDTACRTSELTRKTLKKMDRSFDSRLHVRIQLVHPASDQVIDTQDCRSAENRFSKTPAYDNRPSIRRVLLRCLDQLMSRVRSDDRIVYSAPNPTNPLVQILENPSTVLDYDIDGASLRTLLQSTDPVIRKARIYNRFRYRYPELTAHDFERYLTLPQGLIVQETERADLQPGDVITQVNGQLIQWPFQWKRTVRRTNGSLSIHLIRNSQTVHVQLNTQAEPSDSRQNQSITQ